MAIRGSLKEASLPDVLQLLAMGKKTGCLSVTHRSSFGAPEGFAFFVWPHTVRHLLESDALAPLKKRLAPETREDLEVAIATAAELERQAMQEMIRGGERWPAVYDGHQARS